MDRTVVVQIVLPRELCDPVRRKRQLWRALRGGNFLRLAVNDAAARDVYDPLGTGLAGTLEDVEHSENIDVCVPGRVRDGRPDIDLGRV